MTLNSVKPIKNYPLENADLVRHILQFCDLREDLPNAARTCKLFHRTSKFSPQDQIKAEIVRTKTLNLLPYSLAECRKVCRFTTNDEFLTWCTPFTSSVTTLNVAPYGCFNKIQQYLSHVANLHIQELEHLGIDEVTDFLKGLPHLKHVDFSCKVQSPLGKLIEHASPYCKSLTSVDFSNCIHLQDAGLISLAMNCPHLKSLNLNFCEEITDESLSVVAQYCPELESLTLQGLDLITDKSMQAINNGNRKLAYLNVRGCIKLTQEPLCALIELSGKKLEGINLCKTTAELGPIFSALKDYCPDLTSLYASGSRVKDEHIIPLLKNSKKLEQITLLDCKNLTKKTFEALASCASRFKRINLNGTTISDQDLFSLSEKHPYLEKIQLFGCKNLTHVGIISLAQRCINLRFVEIHNRFQFYAWIAFAKYCPRLTTLKSDPTDALEKCKALRNDLLYKPVSFWGKLMQRSHLSLLACTEKDREAARADLKRILEFGEKPARDKIYNYLLSKQQNEPLKDLYNFHNLLLNFFTEFNHSMLTITRIEHQIADTCIPFDKWVKLFPLYSRKADAFYQHQKNNDFYF